MVINQGQSVIAEVKVPFLKEGSVRFVATDNSNSKPSGSGVADTRSNSKPSGSGVADTRTPLCRGTFIKQMSVSHFHTKIERFVPGYVVCTQE
jgi:hypothetical protein